MHLAYYTDIPENSLSFVLNQEASKHCIQVLRLKSEDEFLVTNGKGDKYHVSVLNPHPKKCEVRVINHEKITASTPEIHIAIAPTKSIDRFLFFIEKCTEMGIKGIHPIITAHSERRKWNTEKFTKTAIAAMKQSYKFHAPYIGQPKKIADFITYSQSMSCAKYIAHCKDGKKPLLRNCYSTKSNVCILIGPEGDFNEEEIALAKQNEFAEISLGASRLRTETAGIVACNTIHFCNE